MPLNAVINAVDLFLDYMYSGNVGVGEVGKPPGTWFSATGWYYSGYGHKHYMSININGNDGGTVDYAGDHIHIFTNPAVADLGSFDVTYWNGWAQLRSGNNFDFTAVLPNGTNQDVDVLTFALNLDTQQDTWWINDNITAMPGGGGGAFIGMKNDDSSFPVMTNSRNLSDLGRSVIYVPIDGNTQYTYDDAMNIVLPALQVQFPNLTVNDFKSESEIIFGDEDPTEESGSFNINYDEILSEDELESILTQETYEIPEYDTEFFTERETDFFDDVEELPTELQDAPNFIVDSVKTGWDILQDWGIGAFFVGCATVCIIWKIIHGK